MVFILLCSLAALAIVIERVIALRRHKVIPPEVVKLVHSYSARTDPDKAIEVCRYYGGAFGRIIEELIRVRHLDHAQVMETLHATGRTQLNTLERGLTVLEIIASVSPLLGLLGTVLGMLSVFQAITLHGIGNPQVLSDGIGKALITTIAGLCVAIPSMAFHGWLSRKVDDFATEMQDRATSFVVRLLDAER